MSLKFYSDETVLYSEAYSRKLDSQEAQIVFKKLCRHYKLHLRLYFNSRRHGGIYNSGGYVELGHSSSFGLMCHEVSHAIYRRKYGRTKTSHNKKLMRILGRLVNYCKKKDWWEAEINKRTEIKPQKPEPTKQEIRIGKIEHKKNMILRYHKKLKFYSNKVKKAERSVRMLERYINIEES